MGGGGGGDGDIIEGDDDDAIDGDSCDDGSDVEAPHVEVMGEYEAPKARRASPPPKRPAGLYPLDVVTSLQNYVFSLQSAVRCTAKTTIVRI